MVNTDLYKRFYKQSFQKDFNKERVNSEKMHILLQQWNIAKLCHKIQDVNGRLWKIWSGHVMLSSGNRPLLWTLNKVRLVHFRKRKETYILSNTC